MLSLSKTALQSTRRDTPLVSLPLAASACILTNPLLPTVFNRTVPSNGEQSVDLTFGTRPSVCLFMLHDEGETADVSSGNFIVLNETSAPAKTWDSDSHYGYVSVPKVTDSYRGRDGGSSSNYRNIAIAVPIAVCAVLFIASAAFFFAARRQRSRVSGYQPTGYQPSPLLNVQGQDLNNRDLKMEPMYQRIYHETEGISTNHEIQGQPLGELPGRT